MKLTMKRNKGFTLLEIIIVVIIVGVLASLALPRLFSTVEYSRSTEAFAAIGTLRSALERCILKKSATGNYADCDAAAVADLDIPNPDNEAGAHFTYVIGGASTTGYSLTATRNTLDSGDGASTVAITVNTTAKTVTKKGGTAFSSI